MNFQRKTPTLTQSNPNPTLGNSFLSIKIQIFDKKKKYEF
jgi:hypothetical protein